MAFLKKITSIAGLICWFYFLATFPVQAASEFNTNYRFDYTVLENGVVAVDQKVNLVNRLANIYATEYSLIIGSNKLTKIKAWDDFGPLGVTTDIQENKTQITITFEKKVLGKGNGRDFHVTYQSPDFAHVKGKVLEVGIPLLAESADLQTYQIGLHVPIIYGKTNYILPTPNSVTQSNGLRHYFFDETNLTTSEGITATFGEFQIFDFTLQYHLENDTHQEVKTQIALPPDTAFQQMAYTKLNPQPESIELDEEGNWLATYKLSKSQNLTIEAEGSSKIFIKPREDFEIAALTADSQKIYLETQPYWPVDNQEIKKLAQQLGTPEAVYNFLVKNFVYDYQRLNQNTQRQGAEWALENPQHVVCMEFTDLFIALVRALGIPARELNGFAYTTNSKLRPLALEQDVLHAWPEYYDEKQQLWLAVDPTWGNTTGGLDFFHKLDLDHFAFVKRGISSKYPLPAGSYKLGETHDKDVKIVFGENFDFIAQATLAISLPEQKRSGLPIRSKLLLKNTGELALYNKQLKVTAKKDGQIFASQEINFPALLPFAEEQIAFTLKPNWLSKPGDYRLIFDFDGQKIEKVIKMQPLFDEQILLFLEIIIGCFFFILIHNFSFWLLKKIR